MRPAAFALAALLPLAANLTPAPALACSDSDSHFSCEAPVRLASRKDAHAARIAITTTGGQAQLMLTDRVVAVQLSDRALRKIRRETDKEIDQENDHPIARAIKVAVLSGVRSMLKGSAECPIHELRDADYRNGRLVLTTEDGDRIFSNIEIDDAELLESFSEADARAFVREFRRAKARI